MMTELLTTIRYLSLIAEAAAGNTYHGSPEPMSMLKIAEKASDRIEHLVSDELDTRVPQERRRAFVRDNLEWIEAILAGPDSSLLRTPLPYSIPLLDDVRRLLIATAVPSNESAST